LIERITDRANILARELAPTLLPNPGDAQGHNTDLNNLTCRRLATENEWLLSDVMEKRVS
jgi:hypothetical protein